MRMQTRTAILLTLAALGFVVLYPTSPVRAYVEAPHTLGQVVALATNIMVLRVEKVEKDRNLILFRKVRDLKGKHPSDVVKHNIGRGGFHPREWQYCMEWAEPGKTAIFFHNGGASETCIGNYWYQAYPGGEWWNMSHGEPFLLRSYAGSVDKLAAAVTEILAGREVVVPCMVDGNKEDLHLRRGKIQRIRASLKLQDYNPKRDFVGWGGEDYRRLTGMPGFTHLATLPRVDADAQATSSADLDGDGKPDLCLAGGARTVLVQNGGEGLGEVPLPGAGGSRAALWADYNGDGRPDLFLATPSGPLLYTNLGGQFRDDSVFLPKEPCYNLTAAAWIDHDADGRPDLLLGNGFHGLRLYRNGGPIPGVTPPLAFGKWRYIGPFDNADNRGFATAYPPEKEIDLTKKYPGKNGEEAVWREGPFQDDANNDLMQLFQPQNREWSVVYLYREITCTAAMEVPVSLGSDDTLTVWLNGQQLLAQNVHRAVAPDQAHAVLKLRPGKNSLLLKVCQGHGEWAFYFQPKVKIPRAIDWEFADVSEAVGLGAGGIGSDVKGDTLTVVDVNNDGGLDFLYGAGKGVLVLNTPRGFVLGKDSGLGFQPGQVGPVCGDFDNDGFPDVVVPQGNGCRLFRNDGQGRFVDVTARAGDLARPLGQVRCAAWGDVDNDGYVDLVLGCLRGPNRFLRNRGDGTFQDATEAVGLHQHIFNTQAVGLVDLNGDGTLDMVFNNEGQEPVLLLGNPAVTAKRTPVSLQVAGREGVVGSRVRVLDATGRLMASHFLSGGDGRGGQHSPYARFALRPGTYRVEVRYSSGLVRSREIKVADSPVRGRIDEQTPPVK